jgi:hypothetical protein
MHRFWPLLVMISMMLVSPAVSTPTAEAADCRYVLGFQGLHDLVSDVVGGCLVNEHYSANGDALQETANGMMVWRKSDNFTAFTDGYRSWVNGPNGVESRLNTERFAWEGDQAPGAPAAAQPDAAAANAPADTTASQGPTTMAACTGNYRYVDDMTDGGGLVILDDGSKWRIAPPETVSTMMWQQGDEVTLEKAGTADYPCYIANGSEGDSANAQPAQ